MEKAGWLTKQGHQIKNWFVFVWFGLTGLTFLQEETVVCVTRSGVGLLQKSQGLFVPLCSFFAQSNTSQDTSPAGVIILDDMITILSELNYVSDSQPRYPTADGYRYVEFIHVCNPAY